MILAKHSFRRYMGSTHETENYTEDGDFRFFGYVIGLEEEWGYFVLSELESARGPLGLPIERGLYFKPGPFSEVIKRYRAERGG